MSEKVEERLRKLEQMFTALRRGGYREIVKAILNDAAEGSRLVEGRLTLASGVPVPTNDVTAASMLYYTPYIGNRIALYPVDKWETYIVPELSLSLGALAANTNFDVFVYPLNGVPTLITYAWDSSGAGSGVRTHPIILQDGVWVRNAAPHLRYLGTIRTTSTPGQCESSLARRFCWNAYNQIWREFYKVASGGHLYELSDWRAWNNDATARVELVCGLPCPAQVVVESTQRVKGSVSAMLDASAAGSWMGSVANENAAYVRASVARQALIGEGYHYFQAVESGTTGAYLAVVALRGGVSG
jgi:hypothetical protein